ncbi:class I SAM-dependent methyltransferase [Sphingobium ummariense]|uniref:Methyltransferase type 11 domain-containing protein n=1 Tax=Sphingobium ummariense RL-3 TaxID=1346791 RepID=T0JBJ1_9SPHN|nr:class I SAM-dependent methyltransferase [Sphingobium ummariense]EQB34167.1 hypothetical protein M529_00705 [Sphingobium ummariense RL-3]
MSKEAERAYLANMGEGGRGHSLAKPYSDPQCGIELMAIGAIISLLPRPPARLLDLGCGGGWTSVFYARAGYEVVGQDIAPDMVDLAEENSRLHGVDHVARFICSDFESLTFQEEFDAAIFFDALHHAEDELSAIRSAYKALKPGGILITHEPGDGHSTNPHSLDVMERFGVTERDMPPRLIVQRGQEVGFRDYRVIPMPLVLHAIFYEPRDYPRRWLSKRRFRIVRRVLKMLFKPNMGEGAIVIMTK